MVESNIMYLPVIDRGEVKGVFSYTDLLKSSLLVKIKNLTVKDIMSGKITVASPDDKIGIVYNKFKKSGIFSIPVVEKDRFLGMVSLHDILHTIILHKEKPDFGTILGEKEHLLDLPVKNIMTPPAISAYETATIAEVIDE